VWLLALAAVHTTAATPADQADWWSFKPVVRSVPPRALPGSGVTHPIDLFLQAKLAARNLSPSPEADRATLIRRLSFDLIGLPPSPEEVEAFAADRSPQAHERLVDRLLASPRHGERWARHWLDVVHFGETHGYDKDKLRPHAWPYRDYVIRAFNEDKPWSRFVEEQLAGDVLFPDDPEGVVALGFIAAGPWDFVGHVELPESKTDGLIARYNDRDDMVMTTMSSFQSFTVHCARCHDHKFDPISQKDYYSLQAIFAGVDRANRPYDPDRANHAARRTLTTEKKSLEARRAELKKAMAAMTSPELQRADQEILALQSRLGPTNVAGGKSPGNGYHSSIEAGPDSAKWVQIDLGRGIAIDEVRLVPARPTDFADTPGFGFPGRFKVEASDDETFATATVLADYTAADFKNPGAEFVGIKTSGASLPRARLGPFRFLRVTATRLWERTHDYVFALAEVQTFVGGTNVARGASVKAQDSIEGGRWAKKFLVDGYDSRARLLEPSDPAERARQSTLRIEADRLMRERRRLFDALLDPVVKTESDQLEARLEPIERKLAALPAPQLVYAGAGEFKAEGGFVPARGVRPVHLLARGDVRQPRELMAPAALPAVPGPEVNWPSAGDRNESARRAALARWLTDPKNLQTRRSIVNRVWQYHFGRGLVDTPNDFGHMGSAPTHPELLDWLACWFLDHGESLKQLHRLLVTSQAYRQVSSSGFQVPGLTSGATRNAELETRNSLDADNHLLWRMSRTRLDAECIRDAMLQVSGQLDLTMGGPSDRQFHFKDDHSPVYDYTQFDPDRPEGRRRSVYRLLVRSVPDPFMDCLDAADPSQLVARRNTTLTALQALATLNNPFVLRQCEHFAARLQKTGPDVKVQIDAAYRLALSRSPTSAERTRLAAHAQKHGLPSACRILFNSTEFVFVD